MGETADLDRQRIEELSPWIETVLRVERPFKRASREYRQNESSVVIVPTPNGDVAIGENCPLVVVAGPCSVENEEMHVDKAIRVKASGSQAALIYIFTWRRNKRWLSWWMMD